MGMECPHCGLRQAIVQNITTDLSGAKKASDVIAHKLACGHTVGGEEYTVFLKRVQEIETEAHAAKQKIEVAAAGKKAAAWKAISATISEVSANAE